jgi:hypothetical protein
VSRDYSGSLYADDETGNEEDKEEKEDSNNDRYSGILKAKL